LIDWCLTPTLAIFQLYRDVDHAPKLHILAGVFFREIYFSFFKTNAEFSLLPQNVKIVYLLCKNLWIW